MSSMVYYVDLAQFHVVEIKLILILTRGDMPSFVCLSSNVKGFDDNILTSFLYM